MVRKRLNAVEGIVGIARRVPIAIGRYI
jgi:hypothetical protein